MPKKNIPMGLASGEKDYTDEVKYLSYLIYSPDRTKTGQTQYTSRTSGIVYKTSDYASDPEVYNKGDVGLIKLLWKLYGGKEGFLMLADDANSYMRPLSSEETLNGDPIKSILVDGNLKPYYPKTDNSQVIDIDSGLSLYDLDKFNGKVYRFSNHGSTNSTPRYAKIADFKLASNNTSATAKLYLNGFSGKWSPSNSTIWDVCFANRDGFTALPVVYGNRDNLGIDVKVYRHTDSTLSVYVVTLQNTYSVGNIIARTAGNTNELVLSSKLVWNETVPTGTMIWSLYANGYTTPIMTQVSKEYVDTQDDKYVLLSGGTMTGLLTLSGNPTSNLHAATKQYVDTQVNNLETDAANKYLPLSGGTMLGLIKHNKGDYNTNNHASAGTAGYVKLVSFKIKIIYMDTPIELLINQRNLNKIAHLIIRWSGGNTNDPTLKSFKKTGDINAWIVKSATSTWDVYVQKKDNYDYIELSKIFNDWEYNNGPVDITYPNISVTSLPTGVTSATYYDPPEISSKYLHLTGGTMTGAITFDNYDSTNKMESPIQFKTPSYTSTPFRVYEGDVNGQGYAIQSGGLIILGSGESAVNLANTLKANNANFASQEQTYITSDGNIYLSPNCQTIANRKTITIDTNGRIKGVVDPVDAQDVATKKYVDNLGTSVSNTYLKLSGGTMTGLLTLSGNPTSNLHAATKQYVDSAVSNLNTNVSGAYLKITGGTLTGGLTMPANQYWESNGKFGLNMNNSDIKGANAVYFSDEAANALEGINFWRDATHWDGIWAKSGVLYFTTNRTHNTTNGTNNVIMHSGNLKIVGDTVGNTSTNGEISVMRRGCIVGVTGTDIAKPWYKFASVNIGSNYEDRSITFKVSKCFGDNSTALGILTAHIRTNSSSQWESGQLVWELVLNGIEPSDFVLAHNSTSPTIVELWAKITNNYCSWHFDVISEGSRTNRNNDYWTLYNTQNNGSTSITSGFTQISSTLSSVNFDTVQSNRLRLTYTKNNSKYFTDIRYSGQTSNGIPIINCGPSMLTNVMTPSYGSGDYDSFFAANVEYVEDRINTKIQNISAFVKQSSAPSNKNLLWLDTTNGVLKYHNGSAWVGVIGVWG